MSSLFAHKNQFIQNERSHHSKKRKRKRFKQISESMRKNEEHRFTCELATVITQIIDRKTKENGDTWTESEKRRAFDGNQAARISILRASSLIWTCANSNGLIRMILLLLLFHCFSAVWWLPVPFDARPWRWRIEVVWERICWWWWIRPKILLKFDSNFVLGLWKRICWFGLLLLNEDGGAKEWIGTWMSWYCDGGGGYGG
jgi:hypothetical protein